MLAVILSGTKSKGWGEAKSLNVLSCNKILKLKNTDFNIKILSNYPL